MAEVTILQPTNLTNVTNQLYTYNLPPGLSKKTIRITITAITPEPDVATFFADLEDADSKNGTYFQRGTIGPWSGSYDSGMVVDNPIEQPNRYIRLAVTVTGTVQVGVVAITA